MIKDKLNSSFCYKISAEECFTNIVENLANSLKKVTPILVFIPSLGNFIVPDLLGGAKVMMIGNLIEQSFIVGRNWPFGSALSMILMGTVLIFLLIYVKTLSKYENEVVSLK